MGVRKFANGLSFEMIFSTINDYIKKYDYPMTTFEVNSEITLKYDSKKKEFLIRYMGNDYAKYSYLKSTGKYLTNAILTGLTLGIVGDTSLIFLTSDKSVKDVKTLGYIKDAIKASLPRLEKTMKEYSDKKWKR